MIHYSKRLVPVPPTYERIGAGLGRPFSDLIFAKWGFNNVLCGEVVSLSPLPGKGICVSLRLGPAPGGALARERRVRGRDAYPILTETTSCVLTTVKVEAPYNPYIEIYCCMLAPVCDGRSRWESRRHASYLHTLILDEKRQIMGGKVTLASTWRPGQRHGASVSRVSRRRLCRARASA